MAAKSSTLLLSALVVVLLHVSPIDCSRKLSKGKPNTVGHKHAPAAKVSHKPAPAAKDHHRNHTRAPSVAYGSGAWLSGAGATYYGDPNGDGSDG
jgi:hypothetical protein